MGVTRYEGLTPAEWARLRPDTPLSLAEGDLAELHGLNDRVSLDEGTVRSPARLFASDLFGFTIDVDAETPCIRQWYVERFFALRKTAFQNPAWYVHRDADLTDLEAAAVVASRIRRETNAPNLLENILLARDRAHLVLEKGPDHEVRHVRLPNR
jgi:type I pantothenate kinase